MPTHGSCLPTVLIFVFFPLTSIVSFWIKIELVGFTANLTIISCPDVIPPSVPPELFDKKETLFFLEEIGSEFSSPLSSALLKPAPISTPLTAGMLIMPKESNASTLSKTGSPNPAFIPVIFISMMAPTDEPFFLISLM